MGELQPLPFNDQQVDFLLEQMAFQDSNLLDIQEKFNKFFGTNVAGEALMRFRKENKQAIIDLRADLYQKTDTIPIANAFVRLGLAQSRIEYLATTPKPIRSIRRIDEDGKFYEELIEEIDEKNLQAWTKIAQDEEYLAKKLAIELIVKEVDGDKAKKLKASGFKPITVQTGFEE